MLSTSTISEDVDLSLPSTTELHGPELVHEQPTKQDMQHKGMMYDHLCILCIHCVN